MAAGKRSHYVLGADIGGTFTDLALLDTKTGAMHIGKVLTNYKDLAAGVLDGVASVLDGSEASAAEITRVIHGTTLATNALIERRGARTALIVTRGFRDLLEMGRESRFDIYDLELEIPSPLVPRHRVFEIDERLGAAGDVVTALDPSEIERLAEVLEHDQVEAAAVCLLHAFRNPRHEQAVAKILKARLPHLAVSLSSDVMPEIREYERASTAVANAYVQPAIRRYLGRLSAALRERGITGTLHIMASDGGTLSAEAAAQFPVRIVESGPAGGAIASAHFGGLASDTNVIGFDMGGTTAKFCVIDGGQPARSTSFEVGRVYRFAKGSGLPIKAPVVEMIEIGAGGGSIARVQSGASLKIGPDSAGASPGPACYGLGGKMPTVTDADLALGYLDPSSFLGGRLKLDRARAEHAITEHIAKPLKVSLLRAAWGIHEIVNDNMARAAKVHCMERGKDPRRFALLAYGGAGPVHGYRLALALGIDRVIYPQRAGVLSAVGFLVAPPSFELIRSYASPLGSADLKAVNGILGELESETRRHVRSAGIGDKNIVVSRQAAIRYAGQSFDLMVPVGDGKVTTGELAALGERFLALYTERYHRQNPGVPLEVVAWRVLAQGPKPELLLEKRHGSADASRALKGRRPVFSPEAGGMIDCDVYDRNLLGPGASFSGPAIVEEAESTAVIGRDATADIDQAGNLVVTIRRSAAVSSGAQVQQREKVVT